MICEVERLLQREGSRGAYLTPGVRRREAVFLGRIGPSTPSV